MYDWMVAHGVDPARLIVEDKATSTEENLINSFAIIRERGDEPQGRVAIVSSAYHLYRAKLFAQKLGVTDAAGVAAPWGYFWYSETEHREVTRWETCSILTGKSV